MEGIQKFRHNAMNVSNIGAFENIKGGMHNDCKDVYFVRAIGVDATYINDIKKMDETLITHMNEGRGYYLRINSLSKMMSIEDTTYYSDCYTKWLEGDKKEAHTRATQKGRGLDVMLGNACKAVEDIYSKSKKQATASMSKNVIVKMLFWYDSIFSDEKFIWEENKSVKIVAANVEKQQEYLFFYLITLMGCDVLLLQSKGDIGTEEDMLGLSSKFVLGSFSEIAIPEYTWHESQPKMPTQRNETASATVSQSTSGTSQAASIQAANDGTQGERIRIKLPERNRSGNRNHAVTGVNSPAQSATGISQPLTGSAQPRPEKSFEELAQLASSVVLIAIHNDKGEVIGSGSGIMIGREGYILTNNHVASGGKFYSVRIEDDNKVYETDEVIKYNYVLDLALIRIDRALQPIPIYQGKDKLVRGQKVVAIGSPLGLFNSVSDGIISGFRKFDNVDMIQFTAPISHGSSGGAVINMQGEVIGISTSGFNDGQNINLAVGYECINNFIKGFT